MINYIKGYLFLFLIIISTSSFSQYSNEIGGSIGGSNYVGDVGGYLDFRTPTSASVPNTYNKYVRWNNPTYNLQVYFKHRFNKRFSTSSQISYIKLAATDVGNKDPFKVARNLSFKTNLVELSQALEVNFCLRTYMSKNPSKNRGGKKRVDFRAYFFTGLGLIYFTPTAELYGNSYKLRPYITEDTVKYSPISWMVPFGVGVSYSINKKYSIGLTYAYKFTGTDYLDDVSGFYNTGYLESLNSKTGKEDYRKKQLANRTPEIQSYKNTDDNYNASLPAGRNFDKNAKRGSPNNKDGYFVANINFGIIIKGRNNYYKTKSKNLNNRRKVKPKKLRAKF